MSKINKYVNILISNGIFSLKMYLVIYMRKYKNRTKYRL